MERKIVCYLLVISLLVQYGLAYSGSEILVNDTVTYDEVPDRVLNGFGSYMSEGVTFGNVFVKYMVVGVLAVLVMLIIVLVKRYLL